MARGIRTGSGNDADTATRNFDGGADDRVVFGWRKRRGFAGCFADDDRGCAGLYLTLAESFKGYQVYSACLVEGGREIGDVARKPVSGVWRQRDHRIARGFCHLTEVLPAS